MRIAQDPVGHQTGVLYQSAKPEPDSTVFTPPKAGVGLSTSTDSAPVNNGWNTGSYSTLARCWPTPDLASVSGGQTMAQGCAEGKGGKSHAWIERLIPMTVPEVRRRALDSPASYGRANHPLLSLFCPESLWRRHHQAGKPGRCHYQRRLLTTGISSATVVLGRVFKL